MRSRIIALDTKYGKHNPDLEKIQQAQDAYSFKEGQRAAVATLKNYGVSITNEGILIPYNDEWDYLYDTPRRVLLCGNDRGKSAIELWNVL